MSVDNSTWGSICSPLERATPSNMYQVYFARSATISSRLGFGSVLRTQWVSVPSTIVTTANGSESKGEESIPTGGVGDCGLQTADRVDALVVVVGGAGTHELVNPRMLGDPLGDGADGSGQDLVESAYRNAHRRVQGRRKLSEHKRSDSSIEVVSAAELAVHHRLGEAGTIGDLLDGHLGTCRTLFDQFDRRGEYPFLTLGVVSLPPRFATGQLCSDRLRNCVARHRASLSGRTCRVSDLIIGRGIGIGRRYNVGHWSSEVVSRHGSGAAPAQTGRSRPHRHVAHPSVRVGTCRGQRCPPNHLQIRCQTRTVCSHRRATTSGLDIITQVQTVDAFATDIVDDYSRYTTACAVLETAERLAGEERAPAPQLQRLTVGALRAIAEQARPVEFVLDAFLLRAMGYAGWAPALEECARCSAPGPHRAFHVAAGGAVCTYCRPAGAATPSPGVLDLMEALLRGEWEGTDSAPATLRTQASGLVAAHLQWHLERQLRTLPLIERSRPHAAVEVDLPVRQDGTRDSTTRTANSA